MYPNQKLLVANRGEIAVRILRTAKEMGLLTLAIYTPSDVLSPHVNLADEAVPLPVNEGESESSVYSSGELILAICQEHAVTLVHPGYGFLSENAEFAALIVDHGITWIGPGPEIIRLMGIKHEARQVAQKAGLPVVPGSEGLVFDEGVAMEVAKDIGYPVILKATAGGGGMGMVVCKDESELLQRFSDTMQRAEVLFSNSGVFIERYVSAARHIEVQVFGDGQGNVVHMGERECSVQRRNQKVIEESPSPFCLSHSGLKDKLCAAAVELCQSINYNSAGTVEFIVDDKTAEFYFLEMNTRIQVEHPVTEAIHSGLDLVALMLKQGMAEQQNSVEESQLTLHQSSYDTDLKLHSIEARIYSENPFDNFKPSPGVLQYVDLKDGIYEWLRVESWVSSGTNITPFFDPLLCKLVVAGDSREEAICHMQEVLQQVKINGPPNNIEYLLAILQDSDFCAGLATTQFLNSFQFVPHAFKVLSGGLEAIVQDLPGRTVGLGVPYSGPMDYLAFRIANILVGNPQILESLEIVVIPGVDLALHFLAPATISVTGMDVTVLINGNPVDMWSRAEVPANGVLTIKAHELNRDSQAGVRAYLALYGGFPGVAKYLGSKSTSMGLGGYQGRSLLPGDEIALGDSVLYPQAQKLPTTLPRHSIPVYPSEWHIHVLNGPHGDEGFITQEGLQKFYSTHWKVSTSSNRMGIRLESSEKILWARENGGEGGSHPSNILDNGYARGTLNINGDTPVILTNEGPDMGGYACLCTVSSSDMWMLGQLRPGNTVKFTPVTWSQAQQLSGYYEEWLTKLEGAFSGNMVEIPSWEPLHLETEYQDPKLFKTVPTHQSRPQVVFRQAGDSAILVEYGQMTLDLSSRARIHAFETALKCQGVPAIRRFCACIRSTMCHFDPSIITQDHLLQTLIEAERSLPNELTDMEIPGRRFTFPIVLDDQWSQDAINHYMKTTRDKAVYLPSNVDYIAKNNGLDNSQQALQKLVESDHLVLGVGFYLACPFIVPIDPRSRLVGQKMNPSRTYTPRGAIGIAGVVAAIYPVESPGGYQLYGRTMPTWRTWCRGKGSLQEQHWILQPFDQIHFKPITEAEYSQLERDFDAGQYTFEIEDCVFSLKDYTQFISSIEDEVRNFKNKQAEAVLLEEQRENQLLAEWKAAKQLQDSSVISGTTTSSESLTVIRSPLFALIWKIPSQIGTIVDSADQVLIVLEAMKTEIPIKAGEHNIGKEVVGYGEGVKEGAVVKPGDPLVYLK